MSKLSVEDRHGISFKFGSKMTPSISLKKLSSKRRKSYWDNQEVVFGFIEISPMGFTTKKKGV